MKKTFRHIFIFPLLLFALAMFSCKKDKFAITPPSYIQINEFKVIQSCFPKLSNRLTALPEKITDAWVYIDGILQGSYELPAKFPVIAEGIHRVEVRAGIKKNGVSGTRAIYPFFEYYTTEIDFKPNEVTTLVPCLAYRNVSPANGDIKVVWQEGFEGITDFTYHANSDTSFEFVGDSLLRTEGNFSGGVFLTSSDIFFESISPTFKNLPLSGTPIYLEINYLTNHDFFVGLYTNEKDEQVNLVVVRKNTAWNKIYIDITEAIRFSSNAKDYNISFGFYKDPDIPNVKLYFDNIKILHF